MKIAIFSDVHGNTSALDAVLADIEQEGVDAYWVIGDLVALGPYPAEAARSLAALPHATFVRGNTDRYTVESAHSRPEDLTGFKASFPWALAAVQEVSLVEWLGAVPLEARTTLPDGTQVLLVHAAPGTDDGPGIAPDTTDAELIERLTDANADVIVVGHTHIPLSIDAVVDGRAIHVHNLGSVSRPETDEHRAMWTLLTADETGHTLERRFATYDIAAVKAQFDEVHHPAAEAIKAMFP